MDADPLRVGASMRPRLFSLGEAGAAEPRDREAGGASMRPRLFSLGEATVVGMARRVVTALQ